MCLILLYPQTLLIFLPSAHPPDTTYLRCLDYDIILNDSPMLSNLEALLALAYALITQALTLLIHHVENTDLFTPATDLWTSPFILILKTTNPGTSVFNA